MRIAQDANFDILHAESLVAQKITSSNDAPIQVGVSLQTVNAKQQIRGITSTDV